MEQKACNRWDCTHTHTDSFYKKGKNNNLIEYKERITKNLCDSAFDFAQKHELCKA